jgi:hypothetical protein
VDIVFHGILDALWGIDEVPPERFWLCVFWKGQSSGCPCGNDMLNAIVNENVIFARIIINALGVS